MRKRMEWRHLDRTELAVLIAEGKKVGEIAGLLRASPAVVYREIDRYGLARPVEVTGQRQKRTYHACPACGHETSSREPLCTPCKNKVKRWLVRREILRHLGGRCYACGFEGDPSSFVFLKEDGRSLPNNKAGNTPLATQIKLLEGGKAVCCNCYRSLHDSGTGTPFFEKARELYLEKREKRTRAVRP